MPIKFPKFSRRKSSGTVYEPANPKDDPEGAREPSSTGFHVLPQLRSSRTTSTSYSGEEYAGSNRLSSSSTLPSADAPRTPDDYRPQILQTKSMPLGSKGFQHQHGYKGTAGPQNTTRGNPQARRGAPSSGVAPPQLETSLDTSSFFDEDMFNFNGPKKPTNDPSSRGGAGSITPTAPKIALNKIIDSSDYDSSSPIPPPKSYNPSNSSVPQFAPESSSSPYSEMFASPQHMDSDRPGSDSPYHWNQPTEEPPVPPTSGTSPHTSRQLTPANKPVAAPKHTRTDSLEAPSGRGGPRAMPKTRDQKADLSPLSKTNGNRQSSNPVDQDAATVASSVSRQRPGLRQSASSPGVVDKSHKDRDSGWEEAIPSISSSDNSFRSSGSSRDTALTSPMMSRGNTDPIVRRHSPLSNNSTPKVDTYLNDADDYDSSMSAAAALANQYEVSGPAKQVVATKVMTKAQFELYQQQQDEHRRLGGKAPDDDDDDDESIVSEEEETEAERRRETARQRARQDAHLSVYRQQMMKITGSDQSDMPLGMQSRPASVSTSALVGQRYAGQGMQEEDEDDEIPLGILMAHGFPSRNRPPTRLSNSNSQPNLRQSAQNQSGDLPVFARHLPADPYNVGAGLQNPLNRQSLAFHTGPSDMRSNAGGSVYGGMSNGPARGGLVGEIVKAEEQRAYRKGLANPNQQRDPFASQDPFARSNSPGGGMMGFGGGQQPQMGGGVDQTGAMQAQMAQQMQQMMQMQMQWMQMQMQGGQPQQPPPQFPGSMGMPGMPGMGQQMPRPNSTMGPPGMNGQQQMGGGLGVPQMQQRPMSMMESQQFGPNNMSNYAPSMVGSQRQSMAGAMGAPLGGFMGMQPGYTPSIAPSERSNVGLPPRYRPVSQQPPSNLGQQRSMTLGSGIGHNWQQRAPVSSALKNPAVAADEEDEEAGWEELNKKRKEKKDGWRKKKESGFKGMLNFGSTATTPST